MRLAHHWCEFISFALYAYEGVYSMRSSYHTYMSSVHTEKAPPRYVYEGVQSNFASLNMQNRSVYTYTASPRYVCEGA